MHQVGNYYIIKVQIIRSMNT